MEKMVLNREVLEKNSHKGLFVKGFPLWAKVIIAIGAIIWLVICIFLPVMLVLPVIVWLGFAVDKKSRKNIADGEYYLVEDICTGVWSETEACDSTDVKVHYASFRYSGTKKLFLRFSPAYPVELSVEQLLAMSPYSEWRGECYLLFNDKDVLLDIFRKEFWEIDESEFIKSEMIYVPKR